MQAKGWAELLRRLEIEKDPELRVRIADTLLGPLEWELQFGLPAERERAAERLAIISDEQPRDLALRVEAILWAQATKEPRPDLRRRMRAILLEIKARRIARHHKPRLPRLVIMGAIVRTIRERAGLSRSDLCAAAGVHGKLLGNLERGARAETAVTYLKLFRALARHVTAKECVAFYEQWNCEVTRLPWYRAATHLYTARLPLGVTLQDALQTTLEQFILLRQEQLDLHRSALAAVCGLKPRRIWDLTHGRIVRPPMTLLAHLAPALDVDASFLYLLAHPELPSFVRVVVDGVGAGYLHPPSRRFLAAARHGLRYSMEERQTQVEVLQRLGLSRQGCYRSAVDRHVQYDPDRGQVFIVLPSEEARREAETLDLRRRLKQRLEQMAVGQRRFFARTPFGATAFRNVADGAAIPSERHLKFLSGQFGVSEEGLLYWCLRRRVGDGIAVRIEPAAPPLG
jgi:transcriptional regulator with XRE-family HTH domain